MISLPLWRLLRTFCSVTRNRCSVYRAPRHHAQRIRIRIRISTLTRRHDRRECPCQDGVQTVQPDQDSAQGEQPACDDITDAVRDNPRRPSKQSPPRRKQSEPSGGRCRSRGDTRTTASYLPQGTPSREKNLSPYTAGSRAR